MRTPRLPVVNWTDAPADWNGHARFAERRSLVSARVPSHFKRSLPWYRECDCKIAILNLDSKLALSVRTGWKLHNSRPVHGEKGKCIHHLAGNCTPSAKSQLSLLTALRNSSPSLRRVQYFVRQCGLYSFSLANAGICKHRNVPSVAINTAQFHVSF
jgi:hypothetical protein